MVEETLSIRFKGNTGDLEKSSAVAAKSLTNIENITGKVANAAAKMAANAAQAGGAMSKGFNDALAKTVALASESGNLNKTLGELQNQLKRFDKGLKDAGNTTSFNRIQRAITETKNRIDVLQKAGGKLGTTLGSKTVKGSDQATQSLINLSRVAQDAPFGFIGIANNLNPLLESFQRLKKESGSSSSALKALGASLTGPAGIGLALGVVSSLFITFGDKIGTFISSITSAHPALAKFKADVKDIFSDATKSAAPQIVQLETLQQKINAGNTTNAERIKLVKEYNKIADETNKIDLKQIGNLTLINEKIDAQNLLIQQRALSTAALSKLTEASSKFIETQLKFNSALQNTGITLEDVKKAAEEQITSQIAQTGAVRKGLDGYKTYNAVANKSVESTSKVSSALIALFREVQSGQIRFDALSKSLKNFITVEGLTTKEPKAPELKTPKIKKVKPDKVEVDFRGVPIKTLGLDVLREELSAGHEFDAFEQIRPHKLIVDYTQAKVTTKIPDEILKQQAGFIQMKGAIIPPEVLEQFKDLQSRQEALAQTISGVVTPAFQDMFSAILAGQQPMQAFFKSLEQSAVQLINKLIAAAAQAAILSAISGGAAGGGVSFAKAFGKILGFAQGGLAFGPQLALVGEGRSTSRSNPEVIAPLNKLSQYIGGGNNSIEVFGRLRGGDILLSNAREGRRQGRLK